MDAFRYYGTPHFKRWSGVPASSPASTQGEGGIALRKGTTPPPLSPLMIQKAFAVASASEAAGPVASNNLRLRIGFAGDNVWRMLMGEGAVTRARETWGRGLNDDVWRVLLGEGLLATSLSFSELSRLNHSSRRLHDAAWRASWRGRKEMRQRGARAQFAAHDHPREGGAREGARAAADRAG